MTELLVEIGLRAAKVGISVLLAIVLWLIVTGPVDAPGSAQLALLCWVSAAVVVLLFESSPI